MSLDRIESVVLYNLLYNEEFIPKVLPYIKEEYFEDVIDKHLFNIIYDFYNKYQKLPTVEAVAIELGKKELTESDSQRSKEYLEEFKKKLKAPTLQWIIENSEKFCQDRAIENAISDSLVILNGKDKKRDRGSIPEILAEALAVSFDQKIGHDHIDDAEARYDALHKHSFKIPFHLEMLNKITKGGVERKTLNLVMGGTGSGKTIFCCDLAADYLTRGMNVLYITLEMAEEKISQRIDMNLMDLDLDRLMSLPREVFVRKIEKLKETVKGKLIVKEYPTSAAHVGHFRHLIHELRIKKGFIPDVIIVDQINICASSKLKKSSGTAENSLYIKSIAEELRALAIENNVPLWSPNQFNRTGFDNSDPSLKDIGDSWGLAQTADLILTLVPSRELSKLKQMMIKQGKNRYYDDNYILKFLVGLDKDRMKFFDVEQSAQEGLDQGDVDYQPPSEHDEKLAISKKFGSEGYKSAYNIKRFGKENKKKFEGIKV